MIKSLKLENFRQFKNFEISDLGLVNIFVGDNNVGKTSLLEALGVLTNAGESDFWVHILGKREMNSPTMESDVLLKSIFKDLNIVNNVSISMIKEDASIRSLNINSIKSYSTYSKLKSQFPQPFPSSDNNQNNYDDGLWGLELEIVQNSKKYKESLLLNYNLPPSYNPSAGSKSTCGAFYIKSGQTVSFNDTKRIIDKLTIENKKQDFVKALNLFYPKIRDINTITQGRDNYIFVDVGLENQIPINLLGDGTKRLVLLFTGLFTPLDSKREIKPIIIDEIDSGLHHEAMIEAWKGIDKLSTTIPFQLFCSTHNDEMLQATIEAFRDSPEKLRVYRLEKQGDDVVPLKFEHEDIRLNYSYGGNLRGLHYV